MDAGVGFCRPFDPRSHQHECRCHRGQHHRPSTVTTNAQRAQAPPRPESLAAVVRRQFRSLRRRGGLPQNP
jgi:hypothetical protein